MRGYCVTGGELTFHETHSQDKMPQSLCLLPVPQRSKARSKKAAGFGGALRELSCMTGVSSDNEFLHPAPIRLWSGRVPFCVDHDGWAL